MVLFGLLRSNLYQLAMHSSIQPIGTVRKYDSTFYVGTVWVQIGHLHLRIWEQLCNNHSKVSQNIYRVKMSQEFEAVHVCVVNVYDTLLTKT